MAQRRMFSLKIVDTDAFLDMPQSSQLLYFHLSMRADDDGFVSNPKKVMRMVGSQEDDYKVLEAKKFIIPFDSGICVIKHWRIHNLIRADRYHETTYTKEKEGLKIKENGSYSLNSGNVIPNGNQMEPQSRLGQVRSGKDIKDQEVVASDDYKRKSDSIHFELERTFPNQENRPEMSHVMRGVQDFGEQWVLAKLGAIREGNTVIKKANAYWQGVLLEERRKRLVEKTKA